MRPAASIASRHVRRSIVDGGVIAEEIAGTLQTLSGPPATPTVRHPRILPLLPDRRLRRRPHRRENTRAIAESSIRWPDAVDAEDAERQGKRRSVLPHGRPRLEERGRRHSLPKPPKPLKTLNPRPTRSATQPRMPPIHPIPHGTGSKKPVEIEPKRQGTRPALQNERVPSRRKNSTAVSGIIDLVGIPAGIATGRDFMSSSP